MRQNFTVDRDTSTPAVGHQPSVSPDESSEPSDAGQRATEKLALVTSLLSIATRSLLTIFQELFRAMIQMSFPTEEWHVPRILSLT